MSTTQPQLTLLRTDVSETFTVIDRAWVMSVFHTETSWNFFDIDMIWNREDSPEVDRSLDFQATLNVILQACPQLTAVPHLSPHNA